MIQLEAWFRSWVPDSVFSAGGGRSSVEAWYTTAQDIEEVLSGIVESDVHLFVADVIKSFDTVDRGILDRVLSSLKLPGSFRHAYLHVLWCSLRLGLDPGFLSQFSVLEVVEALLRLGKQLPWTQKRFCLVLLIRTSIY